MMGSVKQLLRTQCPFSSWLLGTNNILKWKYIIYCTLFKYIHQSSDMHSSGQRHLEHPTTRAPTFHSHLCCWGHLCSLNLKGSNALSWQTVVQLFPAQWDLCYKDGETPQSVPLTQRASGEASVWVIAWSTLRTQQYSLPSSGCSGHCETMW